MPVKTQGTQLFIIDPEATGGPQVLAIQCATNIDGLGAARDQIETTCLESDARTYEGGLPTPEQLTVNVNFDPQNASHVRLHELWVSGAKFDAAIGWGDGNSVPGIDSAGEFDLPTSRTFIVIQDSYVANVPISFPINSVVSAAITIQLSGFPTLFSKVA